MRLKPQRKALWLVLFFLWGSVLSQDDDAVRDWVDRHSRETLDLVLPLGTDYGPHVAYRFYEDSHRGETPEYTFHLGHAPKDSGLGLNGYVSAVVRTPEVSVYDQLTRLHRSNPEMSAASLAKQIKVKETHLTEMKCSSVRVQYDKFTKLRFGVPVFDEIILHPPNHEFKVTGGLGELDFILWDRSHPLVKWAVETRQKLDKCIMDAEKRT